MGDSTDKGSWLRDEHLVLIYLSLSIAIVLGGHRTWHCWQNYRSNTVRRARIHRLLESSRREKERVEPRLVSSVDSTTNSRFQERPKLVPRSRPPPSSEAETSIKVSNIGTEVPTTSTTAEQSQEDSTTRATSTKRAKERRKRGREVYKDVTKQGRRKTGAPPPPSTNSAGPSLHVQTTSDDDISRSRSREDNSRSSSSATRTSDSELTEETPRPRSAGWTDRSEELTDATSQPHALECNPTHAVKNERAEPCHADFTRSDTPLLTRSGPSTSSSTSISSVSISAGSPPPSPPVHSHDIELVEDGETSTSNSQSTPSVSPNKVQPSWLESPRSHSETLSSGSTSSLSTSDVSWEKGPCHQEGMNKSQSPPCIHTHARASNSPHVTTALSTPNSSPRSTPPPGVFEDQIQYYKDALEASHRKEVSLSKEIEELRQECKSIREHWDKDSKKAHLREIELQMQVQSLTSQLHAMSFTLSQMQMQHYYALHPHVQQSQPMIGTYPIPGAVYGYPPPSLMEPSGPNGFHPSPPHSSYPFLNTLSQTDSFSQMSSNATSPTQEHSLRTGLSLYDTGSRHSPNDLIVGENDVEVSEELAEAILKHPESIRSPYSTTSIASGSSSRSASGSRDTSVAGRASRETLMFASLSELGNPQYRHKLNECDRLECEDKEPETADEHFLCTSQEGVSKSDALEPMYTNSENSDSFAPSDPSISAEFITNTNAGNG